MLDMDADTVWVSSVGCSSLRVLYAVLLGEDHRFRGEICSGKASLAHLNFEYNFLLNQACRQLGVIQPAACTAVIQRDQWIK